MFPKNMPFFLVVFLSPVSITHAKIIALKDNISLAVNEPDEEC